MSDFRSNYPRNSSDHVFVDIPSIQRSALSGTIWTAVNGLFATLFAACTFFPFRTWVLNVAIFSLVLFVGSGVAIMWSIFMWVYKAHAAICGLRGIHSRFSPGLIAALSAASVFFLYTPFCYTLEFLVVRSKSATTPTMKWYSLYSKSAEANAMFLLLVASACLLALSFLPKITSSKMVLFIELGTLCYDISLVLACLIVFKTNRNLVQLVKDVQTKTPPIG